MNPDAKPGAYHDVALTRDPRQLLIASLSRALTPAEVVRLDAWAATSEAARAEIAETRQLWLAAGLVADDPAVQALRQSVRRSTGLEARQARRRPDRRLVWGGGLMAAGLAVGVVLLAPARTRIYEAPAHAVSAVTLADGSQVTLSPGGQISARLSWRDRAVVLDRGDAFFSVSHDPARPFTVAVQDRRLTVLGTRFNVAGGQSLTVSLVEGALKVSRPGGADVLLAPGQRYAEPGRARGAGRRETGDVAADMAWTQGRLIFDDEPLAVAAQRIARASGQSVSLSDPAVGRLRLSGTVRLKPLSGVQAALESALPVETVVTPAGDLVISAVR